MQIFESSNRNTISTTALNYGGPLLKIDRFEGAKPHSPLKSRYPQETSARFQ